MVGLVAFRQGERHRHGADARRHAAGRQQRFLVVTGRARCLALQQALRVGQLQRANHSRLQVRHAHHVVVRVRHVEPAGGHAQAARLVELRVGARAVLPAFYARAQQRRAHARLRVQHLDLVVVGVGHVQEAVCVRHGLRVLQQHLVARAVGVAEIEQAGTHDGAHGAALRHVYAPDGTCLAVRHEQGPAAHGQAARLVEPTHERHAVPQLLAPAARVQHHRLREGLVAPDLVLPRHGYEQLAAMPEHVPRGVEAACGRRGAAPEEVLLRTVAGHRHHRARFQVHQPDAVVPGVRHVQNVLACQGHALWPTERRLGERAVLQARFAVTDDLLHRALQVRDHDAVVTAIGYEEPVAQRVGQHLTGEAQGGAGRRDGVLVELQWRAVQRAPLVELVDHAAYHLIEQVQHAFALVAPQHVALRVDEDEAGPGPYAVLAPDREGGVVHYGVRALVTLRDHADVGGLGLVVELGRVNAYHHQFVSVPGLQRVKVGDDVDAVDTAVRPEVEQHDLAAQFLQRQGPVGVYPVEPNRELGGRRAPHVRLSGAGATHDRAEQHRQQGGA